MNGERIAEVLAAHHVAVVSSTGDGTALVMCSCTHESEVSGSAELDYGDYAVVNAAHQAAILAPLFAAAQAEALREAADRIMGPSDIPLDGATCRWNAMLLREHADHLTT